MALPGDEGLLLTRFAVRDDDDHSDFIIDFGKSVTWIALHKPDVELLITKLQEAVKRMK